jgi:hypothetical protein
MIVRHQERIGALGFASRRDELPSDAPESRLRWRAGGQQPRSVGARRARGGPDALDNHGDDLLRATQPIAMLESRFASA